MPSCRKICSSNWPSPLFHYRLSLTADKLRDPVVLGQRLAARTGHTNSRFRNFAQNTALLGQVSAALYVESEGSGDALIVKKSGHGNAWQTNDIHLEPSESRRMSQPETKGVSIA